MSRIHRRQALAALGLAPLASLNLAQAGQTGNLPNIGLKSDNGTIRSECGVGALLPWADSLWAVTYNSHKSPTGTGLGLYRIDESLKTELVHLHNGTHANRFVHKASSTAFIGPYAIDMGGKWKFISELENVRITATFAHLTDPASRVHALGMEGEFYEIDVATLKPRLLGNVHELTGRKKISHFKGAYTGQGRIVVANNGFYDFGENEAGLSEFDGKSWRVLSTKPHMECMGRQNMGNVIFTTGWDESSVLFSALVKGNWQRYRLPKASHVYNQAWQTEWMRIREVETEHFLMDIHGMFYELNPIAFEDHIWGVKPICSHLRTIPDYVGFRGLLAFGGNTNSPNREENPYSGQPQSGIWFGKTDDLWSWGKPAGWGGPWRKTAVKAGTPSDPFLMTGFQNKVLHLRTDKPAKAKIEVDFLGNGDWAPYETIAVSSYARHIFPAGFSAHWIRLTLDASCTATAEFIYT